MSSQGPRNPGSATDVTNFAAVWSNPSNVVSPTGSSSTSTSMDGVNNSGTDFLVCTNYGFSIPSNATINGVVLVVNRICSGGSGATVSDGIIRLVKGGTASGTNHGHGTNWPNGNANGPFGTDTYGSSSDLWGLTLAPADVNASNFGVSFTCNDNSSTLGIAVEVNYVQLTVYYTLPAPTFTSCSPNNGPASGGTSVTITGTNFVATPTSITFGGTAATAVTFVNSTTLTCTTPAHAAGAVNVVVTNPDGQTCTGTNAYTYNPAPTVTSCSPNNGSQAGGTSVTITGTNFVATPTVTFGGTSATSVVWNSSTSITCTAPAHAAGAVNVVVTNPDGQSGTGSGAYTYNAVSAPVVTGCAPSNGKIAGGTAVTITGANFVATPTSITFGGVAATSVVFVNSTTLTCVTPAHAVGPVNIVVTNPDTQTGTLTNGFTYLNGTSRFLDWF